MRAYRVAIMSGTFTSSKLVIALTIKAKSITEAMDIVQHQQAQHGKTFGGMTCDYMLCEGHYRNL